MPLDVPNARQQSAWLWIGMLSGLSLLLSWTASFAQVTTALISDGTLGTSVTQNGHVYEVTNGIRPAGGPNLYHSFSRFDVGSGDTAHFTVRSASITLLAVSPAQRHRGLMERCGPMPVCFYSTPRA